MSINKNETYSHTHELHLWLKTQTDMKTVSIVDVLLLDFGCMLINEFVITKKKIINTQFSTKIYILLFAN